jgi:hypothetical protein
MAFLVLLGVAPFAWSAYRNAVREIREHNPSSNRNPGARPLDE